MSRGHVDVTERRLKPIYEALDSHNNKKAIQLVEKLLKKQDLQCAKVLKALALLRSGKETESWSLIEKTKKEHPHDESTLSAMSLYFREARRPECVAEMFELAVKDNPQNEEYLTQLFMAYVRMNEYKKQQHVGMSLFKLVPKNPYYYWSVMSLVMQAHASEDSQLANKTLLPLAERMIEKNVKENKMESEAEVRLYMMVLRQQGKDEAALELLTGELAGLWKDDSEKDRMERELLWTLKRWPDVNRIAKTALQKDVDDWSLYQLYFDSVFGLLGKQSSSSITNGDDVTEQSGDQEADLDVLAAWKFVDSLADKERSKTQAKLRGPFLALMELASRSRESGVGAHLDNEASPLDMLHSFFEMFADRSCCYNDLKPYLSMLDDTQRSEFLDKLNKQKPLSSSSEENQSVDIQQSVKTMQRHICSIQLARSMGVHVRLNTDEKRTVAGELMQHFRNGIHYGEGLLTTDIRPNDCYALLAAHLIVDIAEDTDDHAVYWDAIGILEEALHYSPSNAQIKLLLVRLYSILGVFGPCARIFQSMEIRNIQLDTIGYIFLRYASALGYFETAQKISKMALGYFFMSKKDAPEYVVSAYRGGSFHKIVDIVQFQQRVQRSITFPMVVYETAAVELLTTGNSLDEAFTIVNNSMLWAVAQLFPALLDNRDTQVFESWDPPEKRVTDDHIGLLFDLDLQWLRIRCATFRILYLILSMIRFLSLSPALSQINDPSVAAIPEGCTELEQIHTEFQTVVGQFQQNSQLSTKFPVQGPPQCRIVQYLKCRHSGILCSLASIAVSLFQAASANWTAAESDKCQKTTEEELPKLLSLLEEECQKCKTSVGVSAEKREVTGLCLESIVFFTETFTHTLIVLTVFNQVLKHGTKKEKKKRKSQGMLPLVQTLKMFLKPVYEKTVEMMTELNSEMHKLRETIIAEKLSSLTLSSMKDEDMRTEILKQVQDSYEESLTEITGILDKKIKFAASISW